MKIYWRNIQNKITKSKTFRVLVISLGLLIFLIAALFVSFNLVYKNKIFPHTFIGSTNFGGKNRLEAQKLLSDLESQSQDDSLKFIWEEKEYEQKISELDVDYSPKNEETLNNLFTVGRSGGIGKIVFEQFLSIFDRNLVVASFDFNQKKLQSFLESIATDVDKPEKDASIEIQNPPDGSPRFGEAGEAGDQPIIIPEEIGRKFSIPDNNKIAKDTIGSFELKGLTAFIVTQVYPRVTSFGAQAALAATQELLGHHLVLKAPKNTYHIYPKDIASLIEFSIVFGQKGVLGASSDKESSQAKEMLVTYTLEPGISNTKVQEYVEKIASEVNQEPKDPQFSVSSGRVVAFQLAQTGYELDKEKAVEGIATALKNGQKNLELPVKITEPSISNNPAEAGIKELIGEGTTDFSGSPENRRHNIRVGAMVFNGVLIKPGEEFSMLKYLGEVDASSGYLPELVIKEDRTVPEFGGGLCQVSTTMFRAALNTGLKITERQNHSYRVRYYEPPVGMDATIYIPKPDFKFLNEMETPILIQTSVGANTLTFSFYGTKDGRRAETTEPVIWDVTGSGEAVYSESADLAAGEIKQIEKAHPGSKASFEYRVYDASGKLINEQKFMSSYVPWPARYLYGPGTTGIPGQEAPPPAEQPAQPPVEQPPATQ